MFFERDVIAVRSYGNAHGRFGEHQHRPGTLVFVIVVLWHPHNNYYVVDLNRARRNRTFPRAFEITKFNVPGSDTGNGRGKEYYKNSQKMFGSSLVSTVFIERPSFYIYYFFFVSNEYNYLFFVMSVRRFYRWNIITYKYYTVS
jgi:hypothetical protein